MNKIKISAILVFLSLCTFFACTENELYELAPNAEEANKSYAKQFKAIWVALDLNYPIWDYERDEYGLNWDDVYNRYLPLFAQLDSIYQATGDAKNCELIAMVYYSNILQKLHDGHLYAKIKDVYTGTEYEELSLLSSLDDPLVYMLKSSMCPITLNYYQSSNESGYTLLDSKQDDKEEYIYGLFNGDIVYLHFPNFQLSDIIENEMKTPAGQKVIDVWNAWYNKVQELNGNGSLKGVILDVRGNYGGYTDNYQYFLGALHGDIDGFGGIQTGHYRMKIGTGRYDYGIVSDLSNDCYINPQKHIDVKAPIVVLADSVSASMAEQTCLAAKRLPNACVVGTTTFGALSPSWSAKVEKTQFTDWGDIGDSTLVSSSFYIRMPFMAFVSWEGKILERRGVTPDIFVDRDWNLCIRYGRDNQLERALEYIKEGY